MSFWNKKAKVTVDDKEEELSGFESILDGIDFMYLQYNFSSKLQDLAQQCKYVLCQRKYGTWSYKSYLTQEQYVRALDILEKDYWAVKSNKDEEARKRDDKERKKFFKQYGRLLK